MSFVRKLGSIFILTLMISCTTTNRNGELVNHHFGYVQVITPLSSSPVNLPIQALEAKTIGFWLDVDKRVSSENTGSGGGIGYRFKRQELIPKDCNIIFRVKTNKQIKLVTELLKDSLKGASNICLIRD